METSTRTVSIRLPMELYYKIAELAQADGTSLNNKIHQLCRLGMGEHVSVEDAVRRLVLRNSMEIA